MNEKEIDAMIRLLDDPDTEIFNHIETRLVSMGKEVIPILENEWEVNFNPLIQNRIENIIHKIQFENVLISLKDWAENASENLLQGAILVAKYQYPDLDAEKIGIQIEQMTRDIWLELNDNLTALEKVRILNNFMFKVFDFSGNTTNYHAPQNSFINIVLESKKGNPLSLSILYSLIAQKLEIPILGVNLPEHFIVAYMDEVGIVPYKPEEKTPSAVLFYINPFSKGSIIGRKEIDAFLKQLKIDPMDSYYEPCDNIAIIKRLLRNLMYSYQKLGDHDKMDELNQMMHTIQKFNNASEEPGDANE